jgi:hypothetical protein
VSRLGRARRQVQTLLRDRCVILVAAPEGSVDAYGKASLEFTPTERIPCNFVPDSAREAEETWMQVPQANAHLFLPLGTVITNRDRIQLTHRAGLPVAPQTFLVLGQPQQDVLVLRVQLKALVEKP